jgi:RNA polymerase sigma-70 factor (ECF subfamily)
VHCARAAGAEPDWPTLRRLYESLQKLAPTAGGGVTLAAVIAEIDGAAAGLASLDDVEDTARLQPAWVLRAHLLRRLGDSGGADAALQRAIDLTTDPAERAHLSRA